ncbi:MAG: nitronate monooxygenase [Alphaproteobacteria bacterium]|nr:nitronate monooxygenase [Alphaproteobacteria bacterium]
MGGVSGPELVAAVANAGGLGILPIWASPPDTALQSIAKTQALTNYPFAVNLRADFVQTEHISAAVDAGVSLFNLFWGDPAASMPAINTGGARLISTIGDGDTAKRALDVGAAALIAQGVEAGGHVAGEMELEALLDVVLPIAGDIPVIAAGGLATPQDVAHVLSLGASGALFGTRFAATEESNAHDVYKQALIRAEEGSTVRTMCFDGMWPNAPHRVLKNSTFEDWEAAGRPPQGQRPGEDDIILHTPDGMTFQRYFVAPPGRHMTGDLEAAAMYAGTGVSKITNCPSAAEVMGDLVSQLVS